MFLKYIVFLILCSLLYQIGNTESYEQEEFYRHVFGQLENVERSLELLNARWDIPTSSIHLRGYQNPDLPRVPVENPRNSSKPIFDIRYDKLPKYCLNKAQTNSCAEAMKCTRTSGIYNITLGPYSNHTFLAFCDYNNFEGDWLYILRRVDGSENFNRSWLDYVQGFGDVAGEYWIGLENLHALTNSNGPQELNVFLENFEGRKVFARYDNFVVANASENYRLKSLGRYSGTAGDSLFNQLGAEFSTYDNDNDALKDNCALARKGGFWFKDCTKANPTGRYLRGIYTNLYEGSYWRTFNGENYSQKTIIFMIRRQNSINLL